MSVSKKLKTIFPLERLTFLDETSIKREVISTFIQNSFFSKRKRATGGLSMNLVMQSVFTVIKAHYEQRQLQISHKKLYRIHYSIITNSRDLETVWTPNTYNIIHHSRNLCTTILTKSTANPQSTWLNCSVTSCQK